MEKIEKFNNGIKRLKDKSRYHSDPELSFAINWGNHLINTINENRGDEVFTGNLVMSAAQYFKENLTDQQRVDVFCLLLGNVVGRKGRR